jgi:hypothetical protein
LAGSAPSSMNERDRPLSVCHGLLIERLFNIS